MENALKENEPGVHIHLTGQRHGQAVIIQIKDNGVGITREDLPFVFPRFYRVAKHPSQQGKGPGLGLSIVRCAVEARGGSISVNSTPGLKTIFELHLPDLEILPEVDGNFVLEDRLPPRKTRL